MDILGLIAERHEQYPFGESDKEIINAHINEIKRNYDKLSVDPQIKGVVDSIELLALCSIYILEYEQFVFKDLSHREFYDIAYCYEYIYCAYLFSNEINLFCNVMKKLSLEKIIASAPEAKTSISEESFYDLLEEMPENDSSQIIEFIAVNRKIKTDLKKCISQKDRNNFKICIQSHYIEYDSAAAVAKAWHNAIQMRKLIVLQSNDGCDKRLQDATNSILEDKNILFDQKRTEQMLICCEDENTWIENMDGHYMYMQCHFFLAFAVHTFNTLSHLGTDINSIRQFAKCISESKYLKDLENRILNEGLDPFEYKEECRILEIFRRKFLERPKIPSSIADKKKDHNAYFTYSGGKKGLSEDECFRLYQALTEKKLLQWNDETYFSFLYRMCPSYTPERDNPSPIIWQGTTAELFNLIWGCYRETTKIWKKTEAFFILPDNKKLNVNGAKNHIKSGNPIIRNILDSIK